MDLAAFASYVLLSSVTPGPNNLMALSYASRCGVRRTIPFLLGMWLGFLVVLSGCALSAHVLYTVLPAAEPVMRWLGAAYLVWLAWSTGRAHGDAALPDPKRVLLSGMLLQFVNVKIILYGITVWSVFLLPTHPGPQTMAALTLLLATVGPAAAMLWAGAGAVLERTIARHERAVARVMALLLLWCAVSVLIGT